MATSRILRPILTALIPLAGLLSGPQSSRAATGAVYLTGFPALRQQHSLTCEASAASMGTRGALTEARIMAAMPRSPDPNLGFRGNPDGVAQGALHDYGVYAGPLQFALSRLGYHSEVISYGRDGDIKRFIRRGWPVVLWVTYSLEPESPRLGSFNGVSFILVPREHAILGVGFDARTVIANDPWTGKQVRYWWRDFNRSWGLFGNMALAVAPCPVPGPVSRLRVTSATSQQLAFSWRAASNATSYTVSITERGKRNSVAFQGTVSGTQVSVSSPRPGEQYEIAIQARAACGVTSSTVRRLLVQLPQILPGVTPTATVGAAPTEQTVPTAKPGATPPSLATGTPAVTATASPTPSATPHH